MLGHLMNDKLTRFGLLSEDNNEASPSAPASLPSVPSFGTISSVPSFGTLPSVASHGTEEWCHLHFNAIADASTTSASPISPYFPGFASSGSSAGIVKSYSTTPLSPKSVDIPGTSYPLLPDTSSQSQSAEPHPKKHAKFILEDPAMSKQKKDKAMRACIPCFTKRLECPESDTRNRCKHCVGRNSYCKGPIDTPRILDLEWVDTTLAAFLACYYQSIGVSHERESFGPMQVYLRSEHPSGQEIVSDKQAHLFQLPGLRDDFRFPWEPSNLDGVLDDILCADVPLCIAPKPGSYDLSSYERLCRRLCACISLLRRPNECTLNKTYRNDHRITHMVVGFLSQLIRTASTMFAEIYEHIRKCCFATRDRRGTPALMFILAEHLGHIHKEIRHFMDVTGQSNSLPLSRLLHNPSQNLDEVENLGKGLCARAFESTYQSSVLDIAGIHLIPWFEPSPRQNTENLCILSSQHTSFSDILRDSKLHHYPIGNQPLPAMCPNDTVGSWQSMDVEQANRLVGHGPHEGIGHFQDMIIEDYDPFEIRSLQAETSAMLNPDWTIQLHDFAVTQNTEANMCTDHIQARILDAMPQCQNLNWEQQRNEVQQAGFAYARATVPAHTDIGDSTLTSPHDVIASSRTHTDTTQRLATANNTALSESTKQICSLPIPIPEEIPKRASKRKPIKSVFSRKKPCLNASRLGQSDDSGASPTDSTSKRAIRKQSAAKSTTNNGARPSKQPSDHLSTEQSRAGPVPVCEQGNQGRTNLDNAGIARDIKVSDSDRRPRSWPHRNPWRKSLDISVAVLSKGFEKLMMERGESSQPAI